jgi:DNA-binding beta-propeller fold protein YncE
MHQRLERVGWIRPAALCLAVVSFASAALASGNVSAKTADTHAAFAMEAQPAGPSGYHLTKTIPVPGNTFWDYLKFDPATGRLFISRGDHVAVVDVESGKVTGDIGGMEGIHGIVLAPEFNRGFVTDGRAAKVWIFDLKTLKVTGSAPADPDADGAVYDPASKRVFTMNGDSKSSTVVDAATGKVVGKIDLGGEPEFPVADGRGHVYANIESTSELIEIDSGTLKVMHRWPLTPGENPSGLAMDSEHRILFSGCRNKLMAIVNADTGKVIATLPIGQGVDATRFDPGTGYAFSSNGDGTLTVIHEDSADKFSVVENVATEPGARTMALNPKTHEVFLVTAKLERIENPPPHTRPFRMVPDTFHVLVFGRH